MAIDQRFTMSLTTPSDREVTLTRSFNAPRKLVFEALTTPEHVRNWWGPRGTELTACEIDLRVGGSWRYEFIADDGNPLSFYGEFTEIDPPSRIVQTEIFAPFPDSAALVTTTLNELDGVTTLTSTSAYPSAEVRDMVLQTGMEHGAAESYNRLAELLDSLT